MTSDTSTITCIIIIMNCAYCYFNMLAVILIIINNININNAWLSDC